MTDDDDELAAGQVGLCVLATYKTDRHAHHELLLNVTVEDDLSVSGDKRSRQVHAGAKAVNRIVRPDGSFRTCLLYTSPSPRDQRGSRMPSSA